MKKTSIKKYVALIIALVMVLSLAACGDKAEEKQTEPVKTEQPQNGEPQPQEQSGQQAEQQSSQTPETKPEEKKEEPKADDPKPDEKPEEKKDEKIRVTSTEELVDAIGEGAHIVIAGGYYNMSEYLEDAFAKNGNDWNSSHLYTQLREHYDGVGLEITRVQNLTIEGEGDVELVIEPRYSHCFAFYNCGNITLSNMTIGHTETGECNGDVIYLSDCENVVMKNMDLYGCGVIGIDSYRCTDITVTDSVIHDCSDCGIYISNALGQVTFDNCTITDNAWGIGLYDNAKPVVFNKCTFGQNESDCVSFIDNVELNDCTVMEPEFYPDVEPDWGVPLNPAPIDQFLLIMNDWKAYSGMSEYDIILEFDPEDENDVMLRFFQDSTGSLDNYYLDGDQIFWWAVDDEYDYVSLYDSTEAEYPFAEMRMYHEDAPLEWEPSDFIELVVGEDVIYFRPYPAY